MACRSDKVWLLTGRFIGGIVANLVVSAVWHSYLRFSYDFVDPFSGALSRLPQPLFENTLDFGRCSAVAAVAYANLHSRCKSDRSREAAAINYGKVLQQFAAATVDPVQIQREDTLIVSARTLSVRWLWSN